MAYRNMKPKIISGGQSGADLGAMDFAKKHDYSCELNVETNYKPLYDEIPKGVKINIVTTYFGVKGWIERRKYNVKNSDFTIIIVNKPIKQTKGSLGTMTDAIKNNKPYYIIESNKLIALIKISILSGCKQSLRKVNPKVINIAGQRDLDRNEVIKILEQILL